MATLIGKNAEATVWAIATERLIPTPQVGDILFTNTGWECRVLRTGLGGWREMIEVELTDLPSSYSSARRVFTDFQSAFTR